MKYAELEASHHFVPVAIQNFRCLWPRGPAVPPRTGTSPQGRNKGATFPPIPLPEDLGRHSEGQCGCCAGHNQS